MPLTNGIISVVYFAFTLADLLPGTFAIHVIVNGDGVAVQIEDL